jgi:hypothetical protein
LESCALSALESEVLGVRRTHDDVPGWLIPSLYVEYARTGDAREMPRIFYHNAQDILSLVTLTARQCDLLATELSDDAAVPGEDLYGLARFLHDSDDLRRAELALAQAARTSSSLKVREAAMRDLAYLLKRQERRREAVTWWQALVESTGAVYACEELSKHYEWHEVDLSQAIAWAERGIYLAQAWPPGPGRSQAVADLAHRLARLMGKIGSVRAAGEC